MSANDHVTTADHECPSCGHSDDLDLVDNSQSAGESEESSQSACSSCENNRKVTEEGKDKSDTDKSDLDETADNNKQDKTESFSVDDTGLEQSLCEAVDKEESSEKLHKCCCCTDRIQCDNCDSEDSCKCCDKTIYDNYRDKFFSFSSLWPLVYHSHVIVNLSDFDNFESGDFSFIVKQRDKGKVGLWVKYCVGSVTREIHIPVSKFGKIFTMEWKEEILSDSTEVLGEALRNCLAALEDSTEKLRWEDVVPHTGQLNHSNRHRSSTSVQNKEFSVSCPEYTKSPKNFQKNCMKCDKLSEGWNTVSGSGDNEYRQCREYKNSKPENIGKFLRYLD